MSDDTKTRVRQTLYRSARSLLAQRTASGYEQAVAHLAELHDLAVHRKERPAFDQRLADVLAPYATSAALQRRLKEKRLV